MKKNSQKLNGFENSNPESSNNGKNDVIREIVDYSFQKDAYLGHRTERGYLIAYLVEKARNLQYLNEGVMTQEPINENVYIGIAVHSASDLHFIKNLIVVVTVIDAKGKVIGQRQHLYHPRPWLHNYGLNWKIPCDGQYTLKVKVNPQNLAKAGSLEKNLASEVVDVEFPHVMIQTGQHIS